MAEPLQRALREVRDTLLSEPVSPRVDEPADINRHHCTYVAETVVDRVGDELDVQVLQDGGHGHAHTWIRYDGRHYDAECIEGVDDHRELPYFRRHPGAAVHVEPATTSLATVRGRGSDTLYPAVFESDSPPTAADALRPRYWRYAIVGIMVGLLMVAIGLAGEWVSGTNVMGMSAGARSAFTDLELVGELVAVVSPIVFLWLVPVHRELRMR